MLTITEPSCQCLGLKLLSEPHPVAQHYRWVWTLARWIKISDKGFDFDQTEFQSTRIVATSPHISNESTSPFNHASWTILSFETYACCVILWEMRTRNGMNIKSASATAKQQFRFPARPGSFCCLRVTTFLKYFPIAHFGHATQRAITSITN